MHNNPPRAPRATATLQQGAAREASSALDRPARLGSPVPVLWLWATTDDEWVEVDLLLPPTHRAQTCFPWLPQLGQGGLRSRPTDHHVPERVVACALGRARGWIGRWPFPPAPRPFRHPPRTPLSLSSCCCCSPFRPNRYPGVWCCMGHAGVDPRPPLHPWHVSHDGIELLRGSGASESAGISDWTGGPQGKGNIATTTTPRSYACMTFACWDPPQTPDPIDPSPQHHSNRTTTG